MRAGRLAGIGEFLERNRLMDDVSSDAGIRRLRGKYNLRAHHGKEIVIDEWLDLEIEIREARQFTIPRVWELGGQIPRKPAFHVNPDGTLCLGSPISMAMDLKGKEFLAFEQDYLQKFLFKAIAKKRGLTSEFLGGELAHGIEGLLDDLREQLSLPRVSVAREILSLALKKKRIANKWRCPCGCGKRFGRCQTHLVINAIRDTMPRGQVRSQVPQVERARRTGRRGRTT